MQRKQESLYVQEVQQRCLVLLKEALNIRYNDLDENEMIRANEIYNMAMKMHELFNQYLDSQYGSQSLAS